MERFLAGRKLCFLVIFFMFTGCENLSHSFKKDNVVQPPVVDSKIAKTEWVPNKNDFEEFARNDPDGAKQFIREILRKASDDDPLLFVMIENRANIKVQKQAEQDSKKHEDQVRILGSKNETAEKENGKLTTWYNILFKAYEEQKKKLSGLTDLSAAQKTEFENKLTARDQKIKDLEQKIADLEKPKLDGAVTASANEPAGLADPPSNLVPIDSIPYSPPTIELRPVFVGNNWQVCHLRARITHNQTGKSITVQLPPGKNTVVNLLKGHQTVELSCALHGKQYGSRTFEVTDRPVAYLNDANGSAKGYYGLITWPK